MFHVEQLKSITAIDHLVSEESFEIQWHAHGNIAQTLPQPSEENLSRYYDSKAYVSHQSRSKSLIDYLYRLGRLGMMQKKWRWTQPYINRSSRVLDFGCGTGAFLAFLAAKGIQVRGVEPSSVARANAPRHLYIKPNIEATDGMFDFISLWHVLEHLPDPIQTLEELQNRLTPKGCFAIALPNFKSWDALHYGAFWAAWDVPRHLWHFSPQGISTLMDQLGFEKIEQKGMPLDALYVSYLSEKHQGKSLPLLRGILKGIYSNAKAISTNQYSSQLYFFRRKS